MSTNPLPLNAIHHVELLVGNAKQAAYYYRRAFGFSQIAYAGPETGVRNQASYVLAQGQIRLVVSTPLSPEDPMAEHLHKHGDGVLDIAFLVPDVDACFREAVTRGARAALARMTLPTTAAEFAGPRFRSMAILCIPLYRSWITRVPFCRAISPGTSRPPGWG